jgi:hypothetical protein
MTTQLRIHLKKEFADSLLAFNGTPTFENNTNWLNYLKGFYIKSEPVAGISKGAILYFDPLHAFSKMTLYYRAGSEKRQYDFSYRSAARINHFEHDTIASTAYMQVTNPTLNKDVNYLQSMAGLRAKIDFPYLKNFNDSGRILINKAELVISATESASDLYPVPTNLFLAAFDADGNIKFVSDYFENVFGGIFNSVSRTYTFNISRQLQQVLDGRLPDYGYSLVILGAGIQANRVVIGSGSASGATRMKLNLFYTKIN